MLWDLKRVNLITSVTSEDHQRSHKFSDGVLSTISLEEPASTLSLRLRTEGLLLKMVAQWLQYTSLAAWNSVEVRNSITGNPIIFNGFAFDLKAPTYLRPVAREGKKIIPGFLVADISATEFREHEAIAFTRKLSLLRHRKNAPPVLGLCLGETFERSAFTLLRERGVMAIQLSQLGSKNLPEVVRSLANVFESVQHHENHDLHKALTEIGKLVAERETNMAGSFFELMVGRFLEQQGFCVRFFGKKVAGAIKDGSVVERE